MADTPSVEVSVESPGAETPPEPAAPAEVASAAEAVVVAAESAVALADAQAALTMAEAAEHIRRSDERVLRVETDTEWLKNEISTLSLGMVAISEQIQNLQRSVSLLTIPPPEEPTAEVQELVEPLPTPEPEVVAVGVESPAVSTPAKRRRVI